MGKHQFWDVNGGSIVGFPRQEKDKTYDNPLSACGWNGPATFGSMKSKKTRSDPDMDVRSYWPFRLDRMVGVASLLILSRRSKLSIADFWS
jgi:hypothetical protein